jgi:hypothetical protein
MYQIYKDIALLSLELKGRDCDYCNLLLGTVKGTTTQEKLKSIVTSMHFYNASNLQHLITLCLEHTERKN